MARGSLALTTTSLGANLQGSAPLPPARPRAGRGADRAAGARPGGVSSLTARQVLETGRKHPGNPVLRPRPGQWDGTRCKVYGTVLTIHRTGSSRCGTAAAPTRPTRSGGATAPRHVGYAVSDDGVNWERPNLGRW